MNVALIPARGGSKRIPRKNIRHFCGKPMILWSIEAALRAECINRVVVSTDDEEIAEVAKAHGAEVPFMRPAELADDHVGTTEVVAHATKWMLGHSWPLTAVCCLYATAPFVRPGDLENGLSKLMGGDWLFAFSATEYPYPIFRAFREHRDGGVEMFFPDHFQSRSQDLPEASHDAGQFYWGRPEPWVEMRRLFDRHSLPIRIPRWRVHDIDTEEDWVRAELVYEAVKKTSDLEIYG